MDNSGDDVLHDRMIVRVRRLSSDEDGALRRLIWAEAERMGLSEDSPASALNRIGKRAFLLYLSTMGRTPPEIAESVGLSASTVRYWIKQFNKVRRNSLDDDGLRDLLGDALRPGRPITYDATRIAAIAVTSPRTLGMTPHRWTLTTLGRYLEEVEGLPIKKSQLSRLLKEQGVDLKRPPPIEESKSLV